MIRYRAGIPRHRAGIPRPYLLVFFLVLVVFTVEVALTVYTVLTTGFLPASFILDLIWFYILIFCGIKIIKK